MLAALACATPAASAQERGRPPREPDKFVEILRRDGKLVFRERGKDAVEPVSIVVGETIRWINKDDRPHSLRAVAGKGEQPAFDTKPIEAGGSRDVLFDGKMYRKLGGLPAEHVSLKYRADAAEGSQGELTFFSAARRDAH